MWGVQQYNHCLIEKSTGTMYKALVCTRYRPGTVFFLSNHCWGSTRLLGWERCFILEQLVASYVGWKRIVRSHFSKYQANNQQKVDYCLKHQGVPGLLGLVDLVPKRKGHSLTLCSYPGFDLWMLNKVEESTVWISYFSPYMSGNRGIGLAQVFLKTDICQRILAKNGFGVQISRHEPALARKRLERENVFVLVHSFLISTNENYTLAGVRHFMLVDLRSPAK